MSPRFRTLLVLACVAVAGVTALTLLAQRYRNMVPEKSVLELPVDNPQVPRPAEATPPKGDAAPEVAAEGPAAPSPAIPTEKAATEAPTLAQPSEADRAAVQVFLDVRTALQGMIAHREYAARVLAAELVNEQTNFAKVPMNQQFLGAFRATRQDVLEKAGMAPDAYVRIRDAYAAWGEGKQKGGLGAAFSERAEEARKASLGGLEPLDYRLAL